MTKLELAVIGVKAFVLGLVLGYLVDTAFTIAGWSV